MNVTCFINNILFMFVKHDLSFVLVVFNCTFYILDVDFSALQTVGG